MNEDIDKGLLRQRAEKKLAQNADTYLGTLIDQKRLVHELQVHQIELEMQNEALIDARGQAEIALEHFSELFDFAPVAYFILNPDSSIRQTNFRGETLLGKPRTNLIGRKLILSIAIEQRPDFQMFLGHSFVHSGVQSCELTLEVNKKITWVSLQASANINRTTCLMAVIDITDRKKAEETIFNQAHIDLLTGLPNRRLFKDRLQQALVNAHRQEQQLALMFFDLDHFKYINDTLGHDAGDDLLIEATQRIQMCIRESDTLARPGGDEFTLIMGDLHDPNGVNRVAQSILEVMAQPFKLKKESCYISISIGIAMYPDDAENADELLNKADQAMYAAKKLGRSQFCYFTPTMQALAENRLRLANDLRTAIIEKQFSIVYQPIVELTSGKVEKAEALIRWQHPTRGQVNPIDFIPVAEDSGAIKAIGEWVFLQVADQVAIWRKTLNPQFQISVNKSPIQFQTHSIGYRDWIQHLQQLNLPGNAITVEITEGLLLNASQAVTDKLKAIRTAGMQISIDDFGTGYSSLSYLKKYQIDYLKIDRSFVSNLSTDSTDMAICEAMILMAHKLGIKVIAEGIETDKQLQLLKQAGCDYGQGFLFSKPLSAIAFEQVFAVKD
jgi:diguanylate cyclase (GGDEF)-like protein/PAS domain S-box-containing protein